jgi:hypothetical protein
MVQTWKFPQNWSTSELVEGRARSEQLFRQEEKKRVLGLSRRCIAK